MIEKSWLVKRLQELNVEKYTANVDTDDSDNLLRLNANENLLFPQHIITKFITETIKEIDLRTYPRVEEQNLQKTLATYYSLPSSSFVISNGSDPLIESCVKAFLRPNERAISITPTFAMYKIISKNEGHEFIEVPLNQDFTLNINTLLSHGSIATRLLFLNSPNNPTGNQFAIQDIRRLLTGFEGLIVVDEAYVEFAPYTLLSLVHEYDNLILLRTFSKAYGLAGLRIGYSIANTKVTNILKSVQLPYNINKLSLTMARKLLMQHKLINKILQQVKNERNKLYNRMCRIHGVTAFPSETNFILFQTDCSEKTFQKLLNRGILVRKFPNILGKGCFLRVTVGTPAMNNTFLTALQRSCEL